MSWGSEKTLKTLEDHYASTGVMPPVLENRPYLLPQNHIYNEAFNILSHGRQNSDHVINPITFLDVISYCDCIHEYSGEERLRYWMMVSSADSAFIEEILKKRKSDMEKIK